MTEKRYTAGRRRSLFRGAFLCFALFPLPHSFCSLCSLRSLRLMPLLFLALWSTACTRTDDSAATAPPIVKTPAGDAMVLVPEGWFEMGGSTKGDESPVHKVWVDRFLMDAHEVTQAQYGRAVPANPSHFKGPERPVEQVSWAKAALYCNLRSRAEGFQACYDEDTGTCDFAKNGYRLPTEAEWEYACRAGARTEWHFGADASRLADYAWFAENAAKATHPVGGKRPNAWGLFDMYGNVAEWCNDVYDEAYYRASPEKDPRGPTEGDVYVLRGGAWNSSAAVCRSAFRVGETPGFQDACFSLDAVGFRCVRRAPALSAAEGGAPGETGPAKEPAMKTGLVYDDFYLKHETGAGHPEKPERLTAILARLKETGLAEKLVRIPAAPAPMEWITAIHSAEYVARVKQACADGTAYMDSGDTPISRDSYEAALLAAGGVLAAVDQVVAGKVRNAFCAVRPPGHHALKDKAMGFCLFGNVAIATRYVQQKHKLAKVLIVDWDVHFGNGTQGAFYDDPSVMHFDVHRSPFYPGGGGAEKTGDGKAAGTKINVPLPAGSGDAEYRKAFEEKLRPAALAFKPDFVFISAGFDAADGDPLGGMKVTPEGYAALTRIVRAIADGTAGGRIVSVLEGGYDLAHGGLAKSVEAHVKALME